jgi:2-desacetyl-2-hydroxyethyl bacteriochlorophyllide A dehydrogenase
MSDAILPEPGEEDIVVRTCCSGVSVGTEFALIRNKLSWGPYPICVGYQAVGVVEHAGPAVKDIAVGQKVYYRTQPKMSLPDGTAVSPTCGLHCSHAVVPPNETHGPAVLPEGVEDAPASLFVMPAVGLFGTDMAGPKMGETVVVYGVGLIGLGVVAACVHRGCVVIAVDLAENRLAMARQFGADYCLRGDDEDLEQRVREIASEGADVVFECTGLPQCITPASMLTRRFGKFVYQGNYGAASISWDFLPKHQRRLTTYFPCDDGFAPSRRAVLKNMASGALPWEKTITHRVDWKDAPAFYERINRGEDRDILGSVICWS